MNKSKSTSLDTVSYHRSQDETCVVTRRDKATKKQKKPQIHYLCKKGVERAHMLILSICPLSTFSSIPITQMLLQWHENPPVRFGERARHRLSVLAEPSLHQGHQCGWKSVVGFFQTQQKRLPRRGFVVINHLLGIYSSAFLTAQTLIFFFLHTLYIQSMYFNF